MPGLWLLPVSLLVVTLGAELLVRGASRLAFRSGVSPLFVGLTIVGFGTSSPELSASLTATLQGASGISVGNVVGSNIFNIAVILGVTAAIRPIRIDLAAVRRDVVVAVAAATTPWLALLFDRELPRAAGAGFVTLLAFYLVYAYRAGRRARTQDVERIRDETIDTLRVLRVRKHRTHGCIVDIVSVAGGLTFLVLGSRWFVASAIELARAVGVSELSIGLTIVAAGTSLPELVTSLVAVLRRNTDIAVGNILGSNIFNVLGILGACAIVRPQTIGPWVLAVDVPVMLAASLALIPLIRSRGEISRGEGCGLLAGYAVYLAILALRGH